MSELFIIFGVALLIGLIRFIFYRIIDKGADTLTNAYRQKRNTQRKNDIENLSDRYR